MSETSSVSSSSSGPKRQYKCGSCGGIGHNKRACPSITTVKIAREPKPKPAPAPALAVEPDVDLLLLDGVPKPVPAVRTALDRVFCAPTASRAPIFGLLRAEYVRNPTAFSIEQFPHTTVKDATLHITLKHSHPYTFTSKDGTTSHTNAFTLYHLSATTYVCKAGYIKQRYIALTTIDADKKPITIVTYK